MNRIRLLSVLTICLMSCLTLTMPAWAQTADYRVIPVTGARYMWENSNGYCGEASLQIAGLTRGFWVSQDQARKLAGGEALLGVNYDTMLDKFHLQYQNYVNSGSGLSNRQSFLQWIRDGMIAGQPVIYCVMMRDGGDPDYDHIIIAHCVTGHASGYYGSDILRYSDHYDGDEWSLTFDQWANGAGDQNQYYYLPNRAQYGVRITGMEGDAETLPIYLTVSQKTEPNVSQGESPVTMRGAVNMSHLELGTTYSLLRWDTTYSAIKNVPFSNLLQKATTSNVELEFTAVAPAMTHNVTFASDKITIFRLVAGSIGSTAPGPKLTSLSPAGGPVNSAVQINGSNFGSTKGSSTVKFGTVTATTTTWSDTRITATVPASLGPGAVNVTVTVNGSVSNGLAYTVTSSGDNIPELQNNQTLTNLSGARRQYLYYKINVPAGKSTLTVQTSGGSGDCDLYLKFGAKPTTSNYDLKSEKSNNNESCTKSKPSAGYYYIGLYGYKAFSGMSLVVKFN